MEFLMGVVGIIVAGAIISYSTGVVQALSEIYAAAASPMPLILTGLVAIGIGWLGIEIWQNGITSGERLAGAAVIGVGALLALVAGAVWRAARDARRPDHEPRG